MQFHFEAYTTAPAGTLAAAGSDSKFVCSGDLILLPDPVPSATPTKRDPSVTSISWFNTSVLQLQKL